MLSLKYVVGVLFIVSSILIFGFVAAVEVKEEYEGDVLVLNEQNFDEIIKKYEYILVYFYTPWCDWCSLYGPRFENAATELKKGGSTVKLGKIHDGDFSTKLGVTHLPTMLFFFNEIPIVYDDKFIPAKIVRWVKKRVATLPKESKTVEEARKLLSSADTVIVGYFDKANTAGIKALFQLTTTLEDIPFGIIYDKNIAKVLNIIEEGIVYYEKFTEDCSDFEETKSVASGITVSIRKCRQK